MTSLDAAYDNIRLIRRKIYIAQKEIAGLTRGPLRDAEVIRLANTTEDLVRAMQDFAELGFEERVADLIRARPEH